MKRISGLLIILLLAVIQAGCSGAFWGGAGTGALGGAAGYEIAAQRQMNQLDEDLANGKINKEEYNIRKDQIEKGSLLK